MNSGQPVLMSVCVRFIYRALVFKPVLVLFLLVITANIYGFEPSAKELEIWFASDDPEPPDFDSVNEGELRFLSRPPAKRTPSVTNNIRIQASSLSNGWVDIDQCYEGLDPINAVEVVYRYNDMRDLKLLSSKNIQAATVDGQTVQLEKVGRNASLCVSLQARIFYKLKEDGFVLRQGPFERRFLDGYYPFHVLLNIVYPGELVSFAGSRPEPAPGFSVKQDVSTVVINAWFEGKLVTELFFTVRD